MPLGWSRRVSKDNDDLVTTVHGERVNVLSTRFISQDSILYFGNWHHTRIGDVDSHVSNTQYNAFEFSFRGPTVKWIGRKQSDHGHADVYIDGEFQQTVDCYSDTTLSDVVKFQTTGLSDERVHTLRVVVRKDRNPAATDCCQDVSRIQSVTPVSYPAEIARSMADEYKQIQNGAKEYLTPDSWSPVSNDANAPAQGVAILSGVLSDTFNRNIDYLNHCFSSSTYCDGIGWSRWLPASNHGRMLAGAGNALRWGERFDMRNIVDSIVVAIEERMRDDGYFNYYDEGNSYAHNSGGYSERKNYDRVFWTRGLLAAGMAGNASAYRLLRRMYDWFNASPYLPWLLIGGNVTNGLPGGPLMHLSPAGTDDDLLVTERYYDQDYWMAELKNREPLCLSHYPGERPHCYDLLALEAFVDEYRATGASKYIDAATGGWELYRESFKHIGGATALCEDMNGGMDAPYPPGSCYITSGHTGELCVSVFWINVNSKLLQLYPGEEKYAVEIEESIYNVIAAAQDSRGYKRYHNRLQGKKDVPRCLNTCCEVSSTGLIARLPELVYSTSVDGLHINLYASSEITWKQDGDDVSLSITTSFPFSPTVTIKVSVPTSKSMNIRIRVPGWATTDMKVMVGDSEYASGTPGSYLSVARTWSDGDRLTLTLPISFSAVKYTGLDQIEGNYDRYALMYGPILMALQCELEGRDGVPHLAVAADKLADLLTPVQGSTLTFDVRGYPGYRYVPYWMIDTESFTCFPIVQP